MPDLRDDLLSQIQSHRIPGLDLGDGLLHPDYSGQSILNLPGTISRLLGAPSFGAGPLRPEILSHLDGPYQRIVFLLVDALSFQRFRTWIQEPELAIWRQLTEAGVLAPLTSVVPSTTCAALTSIWTAKSPAEHGIVGYEMWLKEYGMVANMITHAPFTFVGQEGSLQHAGFVPRDFLNSPTLGSHLAASGINSFALQPASILGSGLSDMFFPKVTCIGYHTSGDFFTNLRQLIEEKRQEKMFVWAYFSDVDTLSHMYGPDDERVRFAFTDLTNAMVQLFLTKLPLELKRGTLFLLAADHGQINTENDPHYDLRNHPNLLRRLHMKPTGENRLIYLYVKPGQIEAVREYIERTWSNQFSIIESAYAQEVGLFGTGERSPHLSERLGDLILVAQGSAYLWCGARENPLLGRHGGMSAEEILVPLLAVPLG